MCVCACVHYTYVCVCTLARVCMCVCACVHYTYVCVCTLARACLRVRMFVHLQQYSAKTNTLYVKKMLPCYFTFGLRSRCKFCSWGSPLMAICTTWKSTTVVHVQSNLFRTNTNGPVVFILNNGTRMYCIFCIVLYHILLGHSQQTLRSSYRVPKMNEIVKFLAN